jgi:hypothetical protein
VIKILSASSLLPFRKEWNCYSQFSA